jgi:hypothetical protein
VATPAGAKSGGFTVTATNSDGISPFEVGTLDVVKPNAPVVDKANPSEIAGTGEPGADLVITLPDGTVIDGSIDSAGNWTVTPATPIAEGAVISVVAVDGAGNVSDATSATIVGLTTAPGTPVNLSAIAGDGLVTLLWEAPVSDGGEPITGYVVSYRESSSSAWIALPAVAQTKSLVTGLANLVSYDFQVAAVNVNGLGNPSAIVSAVPKAAEVVKEPEPDKVDPPKGPLAYTGAEVLFRGGIAALLLAAGLFLVVAQLIYRRRLDLEN